MLNNTEIDRRFEILDKLEYLGKTKLINSIKPLVSVWVITYQQENFISECLDGILMQKTNFPFEVVIGEDESNDTTRGICEEYADKYPDKIRLFLRDRKLTALYDSKGKFHKSLNGMFTSRSCRGEYIALCEGDDYWTDPLKLQKQVDFLEANNDIGACFTNAIIANHLSNTKSEYNIPYQLKEGVVSNELIFKYGGGIYPTATMMFRKEYIATSDLTIYEISGDELLIFNIADKAKIQYLDFISTVYNRWQGGIFSGIINNERKILEYRKNEINGYTKLICKLKKENKALLKMKRKEKAIFVMENSKLKANYFSYIPFIGVKTFFKKILF